MPDLKVWPTLVEKLNEHMFTSEVRHFRSRELCLVVLGFVVLTCALTYPQLLHMGTEVGAHYDTLFTTWRLAWVAHALSVDPVHLLDANIFHPERATLTYSDTILLQATMGAPLIWLGVHPIVVHNLLVLASFVLAGVTMYVLVADLTGSRAAAWFASIGFAFRPYRIGHYAQLELLWDWPIPLAFWSVHWLITTGQSRYGVALGLCLAAQAWSSVYYVIFLVTALAVFIPLMLIGRPFAQVRRLFKPLIVAVILGAVLVGPYALLYGRTVTSAGLLRREQDVRDWSPSLRVYAATARENLLHGGRYRGESLEMLLFPCATTMLAAAVALWPPVNRARVVLGVLLLVVFDISRGLNGLTYGALFHTIPLYQGLRVPARMFAIVSAVLAMLAGYGFTRVMTWTVRPRYRAVLGFGLLVGAVVESISVPLQLVPVDRSAPLVYSVLKQQPPGVVMEWPMPKPWSLGSTNEPLYMYYAIGHWQRLVNGYSGFYPPSYVALLHDMTTFPSPESLERLRKVSVDFVVLHGELAEDELEYVRVRDMLLNHPDFELLYGDRNSRNPNKDVLLYRFRRQPVGEPKAMPPV